MQELKYIHVDQVCIAPERFRKFFSEAHLAELSDSIHEYGLIHPVVMRNREGAMELVVGERRLRAMKKIWAAEKVFQCLGVEVPRNFVPYLAFEELSSDRAREIEIEENVARVDLSWQERAEAIARLHWLRQAQAKEAGAPPHKMADTAREIFGDLSKGNITDDVRNRLILTENLHDPDISGAATEKEALKILKSKVEREFRGKLSEKMTLKPTAHHLAQINAIEGMKKLRAETFDVICTDPPYGVGAQNYDAEMVTSHEYDDSWGTVERLLLAFASEAFRIAKPQAHAYVFCDLLRYFTLMGFMQGAGWACWPRPIIWVKDVGHIPRPNHGPKRLYECILFASKGDKMTTALYGDVIIAAAVKNKLHAAQKPEEVYVNLLRRSVLPGSVVIDPFCGTGTIFSAAAKLQLVAVGFDNDAVCVQMSKEVINALS